MAVRANRKSTQRAHPGAGARCIRTTARVAAATTRQPGPEARGGALRRRDAGATPLDRARGVRGRGRHGARHPAAELLRRARGRRRADRLGARARRARHRGGQSHLARAAQAARGSGARAARTSSVGEGQPLGVPLSSGGPYFGFMTTRMEYVRQMPGPHRRPHRGPRRAARASRSRCRRASSTSGAPRRPPTSAPTRAC